MLLATLLVCTLLLATMLAYVAHDAARSHRATAERALHDYAAVAAWELVAGVNDQMQSTVGAALAPMTRVRATRSIVRPTCPSARPMISGNKTREAKSLRRSFSGAATRPVAWTCPAGT